MKWDETTKSWTAAIEIEDGASHLDFFSNHLKTIAYQSTKYPT